jgi:hypothetical protein
VNITADMLSTLEYNKERGQELAQAIFPRPPNWPT